MNIIVCDPGKTGWIVVYIDGVITHYPMPTTDDVTGIVPTNGSGGIVDRNAIYDIVDALDGVYIDGVYIESVRTAYRQSSKGNATIRINERELIYPFADRYGIDSIHRIQPKSWTKWADSQNGFVPEKKQKKQRGIAFTISKGIEPIKGSRGGIKDGFTDTITMLYYVLENMI